MERENSGWKNNKTEYLKRKILTGRNSDMKMEKGMFIDFSILLKILGILLGGSLANTQ